ncbi:DUF4189 domain-containing protein [Candidatus Thiosymbion oneisti]
MSAVIVIYNSTALANGALAIDGNQGSQYGFSYDYPTMSDARDRALQECGSGCYIVKTFSNGCAAYAADQAHGSTVYGWATASSSSRARSEALRYCGNYGGANCIVRVWGCNSN